jgi:hypothetical protein
LFPFCSLVCTMLGPFGTDFQVLPLFFPFLHRFAPFQTVLEDFPLFSPKSTILTLFFCLFGRVCTMFDPFGLRSTLFPLLFPPCPSFWPQIPLFCHVCTIFGLFGSVSRMFRLFSPTFLHMLAPVAPVWSFSHHLLPLGPAFA